MVPDRYTLTDFSRQHFSRCSQQINDGFIPVTALRKITEQAAVLVLSARADGIEATELIDFSCLSHTIDLGHGGTIKLDWLPGNPTLLNQFIKGSVDLCLVCGPQVSNALIEAACFKVVAVISSC